MSYDPSGAIKSLAVSKDCKYSAVYFAELSCVHLICVLWITALYLWQTPDDLREVLPCHKEPLLNEGSE